MDVKCTMWLKSNGCYNRLSVAHFPHKTRTNGLRPHLNECHLPSNVVQYLNFSFCIILYKYRVYWGPTPQPANRPRSLFLVAKMWTYPSVHPHSPAPHAKTFDCVLSMYIYLTHNEFLINPVFSSVAENKSSSA